MHPKILITGATGVTGGSAIAELLQHQIGVRALVHRNDERSEKLHAQGVEIVQGDLSDLEAVHAALEGIEAAYFVFPIQIPGIIEATAYFAQAAQEQGVRAIVNMSQISARRNAKSHGAQNHWIAERVLDRSGIAVTHLRPTFFAEWLMYQSQAIREQDILPLPFGDGRYAPITGEDQGRVIASILSQPAEHAGKTYPLYGLKEHNLQEITEILSGIVGRTIRYIPIENETFQKDFQARGFTPYFIQHISEVAIDCRNGIFAGTNDLVEKLTGRQPQSIADYITKNQALFASVRPGS